MSKALKKNLEPGRLLLVVTLLMSLTLISQLYVISESVDLSNGLQFNGIELSLIASYLFTALSMVIVINEFFQVKTKMNGLYQLNKLISKEPLIQHPEVQSIISVPDIEEPLLESKLEVRLDEDIEFERLLEDEFDDPSIENSETLGKYKTKKIKIDESSGAIEPLIKEGELQGVFDAIDEESEMDRLMAESEVIATLSELQELVKELKQRKAPVIA
ncbi:hypothetical protein E4H04_05170 [Candidatus Bathyarchaeota archaeon]|jgi:hypothetical protein|nr:MAG: hypothetical protein E4H04_05170 [Candidatus Bathyarchaeota archaeon]